MTEVLFTIDRNRPIEWLAVFSMIRGYIPSSAYQRSYASPGDVYRSPRKSNTLVAMNVWDGWLYRPTMKLCHCCGNEYPEDSQCWPRNGDGRNGFYSKCLGCKREADNRRYHRNKRQKRALPA